MASKTIGFDLKGFGKVSKKFNKLPAAIQKKHLNKSLRAGANVIKNAARSLVAVDEGKLKKSLKVRALKRSAKQFGVMVQTGTAAELGIPETKNRGYYPFTLEYGTKTQRARPYMRPALHNNDERARKVIGQDLWVRIKKEVS